jgi:hypothetical protein
MEWMLQVVDEIDDAVAGVRHWWLASAPGFELLLVGVLGLSVFIVALLLGAGTMSIAAAATGISAYAAFALRRRFPRYNSR